MQASDFSIESNCTPECGFRPDITRLIATAMRFGEGLATAAFIFPFVTRSARLSLRRRWAKSMLGALGLELQIEGSPAVQGALLVANHVSWIDILALAVQTEAVFVSKAEVKRWPVIGWLASRAETLFLQRGRASKAREMNCRIAALLGAGRSVAIFPEGTTSDGSAVLPFRAALLQAAVDSGRPVQPVAIAYSAAGKRSSAAAFTGETDLWQSILTVCCSQRITVRVRFGETLASANRTRKNLAREAREAIAALLAERAADQPATETELKSPVPRLARLVDDVLERMIAELEFVRRVTVQPAASPGAAQSPLAPEVSRALLKAEIDSLPAEQRLLESPGFHVYYARAAQIPWCLQEIGRLRELSFRAAGEGTGKPSDIDLFDAYYLHLFVWDARQHAIVGAYRMGLTDEILARYGKRGLYTHSLFKYGSPLLRRLRPAIELGRSFVRPEYQRSYSPLLLLWRGIGRFVARSPRYALLIGPVSISNDYAPLSRRLMVDFLSLHNGEAELSRHVKPRRPLKTSGMPALPGAALLSDIEDVSRAVAQIERDAKGVPILLKQYLKLGGRLLGFSVDRHFGDALDGLIAVDLRTTERRLLVQYMGEDAAGRFLAYHGTGPGALARAS